VWHSCAKLHVLIILFGEWIGPWDEYIRLGPRAVRGRGGFGVFSTIGLNGVFECIFKNRNIFDS